MKMMICDGGIECPRYKTKVIRIIDKKGRVRYATFGQSVGNQFIRNRIGMFFANPDFRRSLKMEAQL